MAYPATTTTDILPVTGRLSLSTIGTLSGRTSNNPSPVYGTDTAPYRLGNFRGQDVDVPTGNKPIKFSSLRGAINYKRNYLLHIESPNKYLTTGSQDTPNLYYRSEGKILRAPYGAKSLGSISRFLDINIKGSSTDPTSTFAQTNGVIVASWKGYIHHDVTLWMQINNDTHPIIGKTLLSQTTSEFPRQTAIGDIINRLDDAQVGLNTANIISIAPGVLETTLKKLKLDPTTIVGSKNYIFTNNTNGVLPSLVQLFNERSSGSTYEISIGKSKKDKVLLIVSAYKKENVPLCYSVGVASHHTKGQGWVTTSPGYVINLQKYKMIELGSVIKFYMGPGPGTPKTGSLWGVKSGNASTEGMDLILQITNTPRITY